MRDYKDLVQRELAEIDIGAVFLNAGTVEIGPFDLVTDEQVEN